MKWLLLSTILCAVYASDQQLQLVSLVYRHGDRTPAFTYPGDPYEQDYWPQGLGQLTIRGMQDQYYLGELLREWYVDNGFLNGNYSRDQYIVRSTDVDRTLMSAESQMAALFYPTPEQQFNQTITWQPIPVHTVPTTDDFLLRGYDESTCPITDALMDTNRQTPKYKATERDNEELLKTLSEHTKTEWTLRNIYKLYDTLYVVNSNNLTMPPWFNESILIRLESLQDYTMGLMYATQEQRRVSGGYWAKTVIENMMKKANGTSEFLRKKMFSYSAHDTTVAAMLNVFDMYNGIQPPYASAFIIELYKNNVTDKYSVRFLYRNNTDTNDTVTLVMKDCTEYCPLDTVRSKMEPLMATEDEVKQLCGVVPGPSNIGLPFYILLGVSSVVLLLLVVSVVLLVIVLVRSKNYKYHRINQLVA